MPADHNFPRSTSLRTLEYRVEEWRNLREASVYRCMATKLGCSPTRQWLEWCRWGWVRAGQRVQRKPGSLAESWQAFLGKGVVRRPRNQETHRLRDRGRDRQIREDKEVDAARQSGDRRAGRSRAAWRWRERPTCVW